MPKKETSWRVRNVPIGAKRGLTKIAKQNRLTNAELLAVVELKLREGRWLIT